jgi:hypothetical protein
MKSSELQKTSSLMTLWGDKSNERDLARIFFRINNKDIILLFLYSTFGNNVEKSSTL